MTVTGGSNGSRAEGNTSTSAKPSAPSVPRPSPAIRWCFTLNNPKPDDYEALGADGADGSMVPEMRLWVVGEEVGKSGTKHLQGYVEFKKKCRPAKAYFGGRAHWEKAKGDKASNVKYCSKDGKVISTNIKTRKPIKIIEELRPWQKSIVDLVKGEPDDRTINWFWESEGNMGKSALCKYLIVKHDAMVLSGKIADIHNGILMKMKDDEDWEPTLIVLDIPRVSHGAVSYAGIEKIKDGFFFCGKYEGGMCVFNSPHILVFANEPPDESKMSADRWNVVELSGSPFED